MDSVPLSSDAQRGSWLIVAPNFRWKFPTHLYTDELIAGFQLNQMLDTLKVGISLTRTQHTCIQRVANAQDRWQWVQLNPVLGELRFVRSSGLVRTDSHSYHRELRWDVDRNWSDECKLWLEFSVPKFWYGHNIHLLYKFIEALKLLKEQLDDLFGLRRRAKLPNPTTWQVYRADICYAWRFPSQTAAQEYLNSLKHLHYPRKHPIIHPTSIVFVGATYSFKFYLKLPEFKVHDRKELLKAKATLEWINHLEALADGVLRCEVTLRRQWLKKYQLTTVSDLLKTSTQMHWDEVLVQSEGFMPEVAAVICLKHWEVTKQINVWKVIETNNETPLVDGMYLTAPYQQWLIGDQPYTHVGGGFTIRIQDQLVILVQSFIDRFLGKEVKMLEANQVEAKLLETYKPVKAARLVSLWLYVQRFGTERAKECFGRDSFYRSKRDLKKAGISLIEADKLVTTIDDEFLRNFAPAVPSIHVVNTVDDFRDRSNVLNFVPKVSGQY